jgi:deoxyribodipyrimidine photo-lyase
MPVTSDLVIFWFRRDLRLEDNVALFHALNSGKQVLPIFIFDTEILHKLQKNDARVSFIYKTLVEIHQKLEKLNSGLLVKFGNPLEVFEQLVSQYKISTVYTNKDYEPYATNRDHEVKQFLAASGKQFQSFKDQVIFEENDIVKTDEKPYSIYTPYSKKWMEALHHENYTSIRSEALLQHFLKHKIDFPTMEMIGFEESEIKVPDFDISDDLIFNYEKRRNFPAKNGTSHLSPHLRFGTISIRRCVQRALQFDDTTFLKELIWREFFMQILWHYPQSSKECFKPKYERIVWRNNEREFKAWCEGKTGYPIVDAGMRELNTTGIMHNRVRMITASFLCKHLLIDWRWGEAYFAEKLLDYDMAQNVGNWQWSAGTGCDSAPYFRIFNPTEQVKKFDNQLQYVIKWVPEFQDLSYVTPIVDHKIARERCLKRYKEGLDN